MPKNQIKSGALLSYAVLILNNVIALIFTPYMLRMMGQSEYGLYSLIASVVSYLTIMDLGLGNAIVRYTAKYIVENKRNEQYSMFGMFLLIYCLIGFFVFIIGILLYFNVDHIFGYTMGPVEIYRAKIMILLMVANLAITFPLSMFGSIINAYEDFIFQKVINIVRLILSTLLMVILLKLGYRAVGMVVVATVFNIFGLVTSLIYCFYVIKIRICFTGFQTELIKEIALYSFYIFINIIMDKIYWSTGQFILGAMVGAAAVAVFAVAINFQNMYMSLSLAVSGVFLPRVTAMTLQGCSDKEISDLFIRIGRIQYVVLAYVLTGFMVFGRYFVIFWAGPDYVESYYISLIFLIPLTVPLVQNLGLVILQARNQMKFRSVLFSMILLISLISQIIFAKIWGGIGVALGVSLGLIAGQIVAMNIYYRKVQNIDIKLFWQEIIKMSVIPLVMCCLSLFMLQYIRINTVWDLSLGICLFSLVYIPLFWSTSLRLDEKMLIIVPLKRMYTRIFIGSKDKGIYVN